MIKKSPSVLGQYDGYKLVGLPEQNDPQCVQAGLLLGTQVLGFVGIHSDGKIDIHLAEKSKNHLFPMEPKDLVEAIVKDQQAPKVEQGQKTPHHRRIR
ncbi:hypothetical protein ABIB38_004817 [Massilia sp. UYP11]|uniref:hypothetical protein n=1 Tax=Massilia sp. UYP11 TaxID=1756385 RepID=UPI003D253517